ncbi:MAG: hypothetical protein AAFZ18_30520, partial [Myxococcota bacterium]
QGVKLAADEAGSLDAKHDLRGMAREGGFHCVQAIDSDKARARNLPLESRNELRRGPVQDQNRARALSLSIAWTQ